MTCCGPARMSAPDAWMRLLPTDVGRGVDREGILLQVAAKQHLVFTLAQALSVGMTARSARRRVQLGKWRRLFRAVYMSAAAPVAWEQLVMGACLACGPEAYASYDSAEVVWGLGADLHVPHVTVPTGSTRSHTGIEIHRCERREAMSRDGFVVTTPMRTLLDLAGCRSELTVEAYVDDALRRRLIAVQRFERYLAEPGHATRPGAALLRRILADRDPHAPIASYLETLFFRAIRTMGLPKPVPQHPVHTRHGKRYIDFPCPDQMLAIELDGHADRANREAFENDRVRQNDLEDLGWRFRRFTKRMLESDTADVGITLGRALGLSPRRWG